VARTADWWAADAPGVPRDPALEVLIHQTLVGAHPLPPERAHPYLDKAMREAKTITSWLDQHAGFEAAAHALLDRLLTDPEHRGELDALMEVVLVPGRINALTQKLLALTVPGVPDIYQGTELWSLDLVDPDNRRPVDYPLRRSLLRQVAEPGADPGGTLADPADPGIAKMLVVHRALAARRDHTAAFLGPTAGYRPLTSTGTAADHVVAFERGTGEARVATVAPRLPLTLARAGGWRDTRIDLAGGRWHDVLSSTDVTGGDVLVSELTERFPMALLVRT
jgi:(1->4)-alpha-D-glucan 1-alpha-D-glucosylmutase